MKFTSKIVSFLSFPIVILYLLLLQLLNLALIRLIEFTCKTILSGVASDDKMLQIDNSLESSKFLTTVEELIGEELSQRKIIMADWRQQVNKESRNLALRNEKEYTTEPIIRCSPLCGDMGVTRKKVSFSDLLEQNNENTSPISASRM